MQQPYELSRQQLRRCEIAEWIFTAAESRPYVDVGLVGLFDQYDAAQQQILADELDDLERCGWIGNLVTPLSFGAYSCHLTGEGADAVEDLQQRRGDVAQRRKHVRDIALRDLFDQKHGAARPARTFYGEQVTQDERDGAHSWLFDRGYVRGQKTAGDILYTVFITAKGEDCVEEGRSVNDGNVVSRSTASTTITTITGNNNTVAHTGAGDVTQTVTATTITAAEREEVLQLLTTYEQVRSLLNIGPAETEAADAAVVELKELAAKPGVFKGQLLPALKSLAKGVGTSASAGVGDLVVKAIHRLIGLLQ